MRDDEALPQMLYALADELCWQADYGTETARRLLEERLHEEIKLENLRYLLRSPLFSVVSSGTGESITISCPHALLSAEEKNEKLLHLNALLLGCGAKCGINQWEIVVEAPVPDPVINLLRSAETQPETRKARA